MPIPIFDLICDRIKPLIQKQHTRLRSPIDPEDRLEATLQFLVSGIAYSRLQWSAIMHETSLGRIVPEVCHAIYETLGKEFIKFPTSDEEWEEISKHFFTEWHFPNCIGAIDGKHIEIIPPPNSGSTYFNYKGTVERIIEFSIKLLTIVQLYDAAFTDRNISEKKL